MQTHYIHPWRKIIHTQYCTLKAFLHSIVQSLNKGLHRSSYPFSTLACTAETMPSRIPSGSLTDVESSFPLLEEDTKVTVKTVLNSVLNLTNCRIYANYLTVMAIFHFCCLTSNPCFHIFLDWTRKKQFYQT